MLNLKNISCLYVGQRFSNFTNLYTFLTGEPLPAGGRNKDFIEKQLSQHIRYCKVSEIDPNEKAKRAIIITEIFETPQLLPENRGKAGKYADYLKPLLLAQKSFSGKFCGLCNTLGIFKKFFDFQYGSSKPGKGNYKYWIDRNLWEIEKAMAPGEIEYRSNMQLQINKAMERALNSLQKEGLIEWRYYYQLRPDVTIDIEESHHRRPQSKEILSKRQNDRETFWKKLAGDENLLLHPKSLDVLNIFSPGWGGSLSKADYIGLVIRDDCKTFPIRATPIQEEAIRELELFMRQYAYKEYHKKESLPAVADLPKEYEFFQDRQLAYCYKRIIKEMYPWLIACKIWREIGYEVIASEEQIARYIGPKFEKNECAEKVSCAFLQYMDEHMAKIMFVPDKARKDLNKFVFGKSRGQIAQTEQAIAESVSATKLHGVLKTLYPI